MIKFAVSIFDEAANISLRVDSAICGLGAGNSGFTGEGTSALYDTSAMENLNVENSVGGKKCTSQRLKYSRNNACLTCHKVWCSPRKH